MISANESAKKKFWEVVDKKLATSTDRYAMLKNGIEFMLNQMPTWAILRAASTMKNWKP